MDPRIRIHPKMSWICNTGSQNYGLDPGSRKNLLQVPDTEVKKAPDLGSRSTLALLMTIVLNMSLDTHPPFRTSIWGGGSAGSHAGREDWPDPPAPPHCGRQAAGHSHHQGPRHFCSRELLRKKPSSAPSLVRERNYFGKILPSSWTFPPSRTSSLLWPRNFENLTALLSAIFGQSAELFLAKCRWQDLASWWLDRRGVGKRLMWRQCRICCGDSIERLPLLT